MRDLLSSVLAAGTAHGQSGAPGGASLALAVVALGALYVAGSWLWPYTRCGKCKGSGRNRGSTGKRYGKCRRCKGSGERLRAGARVIRAYRAQRRR